MRVLAVRLIIFSILGLATVGADGSDDVVGEFSIRSVVPLPADGLASLQKLAIEDQAFAPLVRQLHGEARPLLEQVPQPLKTIHYEGFVNTDERRIATVAKLREMDDVATLVRYWQVSDDPRAAEALRRFIIAWSSTYTPTGNDVNENKLYPIFVAYHHLRDTFEADERKRVDAWLAKIGKLHVRAAVNSNHLTNRYTKSLRIVALSGAILNEKQWQATAEKGAKRFIQQSLRADGTSRDLEHRDSLTYHASALRPLIELAMLAGAEGPELYTWTSGDGGSIKKSVDYIVPYALGEKTHEEWVHSKVDLDRRRAEAGLKKYRRGRHYDPRDALRVMEEASYFDPELQSVVDHLRKGEKEDAASWQLLINKAARSANTIGKVDAR